MGFYLRKQELATLTRRAPEAFWPGSVSGSCPPLVLVLAPPLLWPGFVSGSCPPLVLLLAAPLTYCSPNSLLLGFYLGKQELATALCPGLVLLLSLSWPRP